MKRGKPQIFGIVATIILGILTTLAFVLQIYSLSNTTSKLEMALFNIIEFILSLGFGWVLTRMVTEEEFERSLKRFAISAYRRIADVEKVINRLSDDVIRMRRRRPSDSYCELDIIHAVIVNTRATLRSATADWADVIGEELATLQKIQTLEEEKAEILTQEPLLEDATRVEELQSEIMELLEALPASLKYERKRGEASDVDEAVRQLQRIYERGGSLASVAFWDPTFEHDPQGLKPGDKVRVSIGDVDRRVGALIVWDENDRSIGVVTNLLGGSYDNFIDALQRCFGKSQYAAEIVAVEKTLVADDRRYFSIRILDTPQTYDDKE